MADIIYIKPSDSRSWLHCKRRVWYDNFPPAGQQMVEANDFDQLIMTLGIRHEWGIKRDLEKQYKMIEAVSAEHTSGLMQAGAEVIYQGEIIDKESGIIGKPDFLIRHSSGAYQAADAKLSRNEEKKEIQIQLGVYRKLLKSNLPALVFLGDKSTVEIGDEADKEADKFLEDMHIILANKNPPEVRYSETKCKICPYTDTCKPQFEAKQELTLIYGIESRCAPGLEQQGIPTITALAAADPETIDDVPYLKGIDKKKFMVTCKA